MPGPLVNIFPAKYHQLPVKRYIYKSMFITSRPQQAFPGLALIIWLLGSNSGKPALPTVFVVRVFGITTDEHA